MEVNQHQLPPRCSFILTVRNGHRDTDSLFFLCFEVSELLPDRLSIDPTSPYYNESLSVRGVGIRLNGVEKTNVEEYCVSEGWARVNAGKSRDRKGRPLMMKLRGTVEPYLKDATSVQGEADRDRPAEAE
jgi:hypothetical protein